MKEPAKKRRRLRSLLGCGFFVLVVVVVTAGFFAWAVSVYQGLVRERIRVEQAWTDVEAAFEHRLQLVPDFLRMLRTEPGFWTEDLEALEEARARARRPIPTPELLNRPKELAEYERAQQALGTALERTLARIDDVSADADPRIRELGERFRANGERLHDRVRNLHDVVGAYNAALERNVAALIAAPLDFRPKASLDPTFYNAAREP